MFKLFWTLNSVPFYIDIVRSPVSAMVSLTFFCWHFMSSFLPTLFCLVFCRVFCRVFVSSFCRVLCPLVCLCLCLFGDLFGFRRHFCGGFADFFWLLSQDFCRFLCSFCRFKRVFSFLRSKPKWLSLSFLLYALSISGLVKALDFKLQVYSHIASELW